MKSDHKDIEQKLEPDSLLEKIEANTNPQQVSQAIIATILLKLKKAKTSDKLLT